MSNIAKVKNPLISIIIPVYNVEAYLSDCLKSVVDQTYTQLEIICVNDGSTDSSVCILNEFESRDKRFVIVHQDNSGLSSARNTGMNNVRGDFIYFLDADDWLEPEAIEVLLSVSIETGCLVVSGAVRKYFMEDGSCKQLKPNRKVGLIDLDKDGFFSVETPVWNKLYHCSTIYNIRFEPDLLHEDEDFYWKFFSRNRAVYAVEDFVINYRIRKGSLTSSISRKNSYQDNFITIVDNAYGCARNDPALYDEFVLYSLYMLSVLKERGVPYCSYEKHLNRKFNINTSFISVNVFAFWLKVSVAIRRHFVLRSYAFQ